MACARSLPTLLKSKQAVSIAWRTPTAKIRMAVFCLLGSRGANLQQPLHVRAFSIAPNRFPNTQTMDLEKKKPANAWCCIASISKNKPIVESVVGDAATPTHFRGVSGYDITTSPDWMEWIEVSEDRGNDEGGAGAYDTLRCDLIVKEPQGEETGERRLPRHTTWGEDYHLQRLVNSFSSLLDETRDNLPETAIQDATEESHELLQALIQEAQSSPFLKENSLIAPGEKEDEDHTWIQLLKFTLLWSFNKESRPSSSSSSSSIVVRGHACSSATPIPVFRSVQPIVVTLAALGQREQYEGEGSLEIAATESLDAQIDSSLPSRFQKPQSKVASWCKQRKKMDDPETYKPTGVSEVLMLRPTTTNDNNSSAEGRDLEILEGLSSNAFVIYQDGTLRTAEEGVLHGYVRHLVLQSAKKCGLQVNTTQPICLQDGIDGKWKECFVTSSSRLIWPVSRILLPSSVAEACSVDADKCEIDGFSEFWKDPCLEGFSLSTPQWQELLEEILHSAGYKR